MNCERQLRHGIKLYNGSNIFFPFTEITPINDTLSLNSNILEIRDPRSIGIHEFKFVHNNSSKR